MLGPVGERRVAPAPFLAIAMVLRFPRSVGNHTVLSAWYYTNCFPRFGGNMGASSQVRKGVRIYSTSCIRSSSTPSGPVTTSPERRKPHFSRTRTEPAFSTCT